MNWLKHILALGLAGNGLTMLLSPGYWYEHVPGVSLTGPLNTHFVRDIGCAYIAASAALAWALLEARLAWPMTALAALFLVLHAAVHLYELSVGICGWGGWLRAFPGVTLPALLTLLVIGVERTRRA
mgnify:CR=1 FL=1